MRGPAAPGGGRAGAALRAGLRAGLRAEGPLGRAAALPAAAGVRAAPGAGATVVPASVCGRRCRGRSPGRVRAAGGVGGRAPGQDARGNPAPPGHAPGSPDTAGSPAAFLRGSMLRPSRRRALGDRCPGCGAPCARPDAGLARGCFSARLGFEAKSKRRPAGSETCGGPGPWALTGLSGAGRSSSLADPRASWGARPGGRGVLGGCSVPGAASCWLRAGRCGALLGPGGDPGTERADPAPVVVGPWGARERVAAGGRPESATEVGRAAANPAGALGAPRRCSGRVRGAHEGCPCAQRAAGRSPPQSPCSSSRLRPETGALRVRGSRAVAPTGNSAPRAAALTC